MDRTIGNSLSRNERHSAETIDVPASSLADSGRPWREAARRQVALVEGSAPHLTEETRDLVRRRLRIAAILLSIGFLSFSPRWLFYLDELARPEVFWLLVIHVGTSVVLVLSAAFLCRTCVMPLGKLRFAEVAIFGAPAIYFIAMMYQKLQTCATLPDGHDHIPVTIGGWLLLIFVYALFIPNTWQRALAVLAAMGIAPLAVNYAAYLTCPAFRQLTQTQEYNSYHFEYAMLMALAVMISTVGVHTIGSLRREAFAARQLGQYRLKQRLGSGGMGEVYLAEHQMMKRPVAIKVIHADKAGDPRVLARFEREVRMTAKLSHWNSIDIFDYGRTADGTFYYVMEFLPGHNIGELVDDYGPLPAGRVIHLMDQTCAALAEAHGIGLVHRDIKPANIFCAYRGGVFDVAKLLDFGLAKPLIESQENVALTRDGAVTGSPLFMSPEQATGKTEPDVRSDIYSLGAVMYFMLTGRPPFDYENPIKVMVAHASENLVAPREINSDVPEALEEIVLRCLEKDPEHRFQDATSLRQALLAVDVAEPWSSEAAAEWWSCNGCPVRKALAAELVEAAAV